MTLSEQVCGSLRYGAEEIRRDTSQRMISGMELLATADAIEGNEDVTGQLGEAEQWMVEPTSFDLGAVLELLEDALASGVSLLEWSYSVKREAESVNKREHGWG